MVRQNRVREKQGRIWKLCIACNRKLAPPSLPHECLIHDEFYWRKNDLSKHANLPEINCFRTLHHNNNSNASVRFTDITTTLITATKKDFKSWVKMHLKENFGHRKADAVVRNEKTLKFTRTHKRVVAVVSQYGNSVAVMSQTGIRPSTYLYLALTLSSSLAWVSIMIWDSKLRALLEPRASRTSASRIEWVSCASNKRACNSRICEPIMFMSQCLFAEMKKTV